DPILFAYTFGIFFVFVVVFAWVLGIYAARALSSAQMLVYYSSLGVLAAISALAMGSFIVPAAKRRMGPVTLSILILAGLSILSWTVFHEEARTGFVTRGVKCLMFGCIAALVGGICGWFFIRRGFLASPIAAMSAFGAFAGLAGFTVLALHCP